MKCMIRLENQGDWRGPFEVDYHWIDWVKLQNQDGCYFTVPCSWTLGIDDGWTIWEGGERPDGITPSNVDVMFRNGAVGWSGDFVHEGTGSDIVAYRIVGAKRLQPLDHEPDDGMPLSVILDRTLWWLEDDGIWLAVERHDPNDDVYAFRLSDDTWVSRDWFTGRQHLTSD